MSAQAVQVSQWLCQALPPVTEADPYSERLAKALDRLKHECTQLGSARLVPAVRIERTTFRLQGGCSTN
jgi:hypothetical protein